MISQESLNTNKPVVHVIGTDGTVRSLFHRTQKYRIVSDFIAEKAGWDEVDLAVFTGGSDLSPLLYGETPNGAYGVQPQRDRDEVEWFHYYQDIPKIGICRGAQLFCILNGGKLIQDVNNHHHEHMIEDRYGKKVKTSSVHHQMMVLPKTGECVAWAYDTAFVGRILKEPEVVWFPESLSFGVQGHPEYGPNEFESYFWNMVDIFISPLVEAKMKAKGNKT